MRAAAEDGDALAFKLPHDKVGGVARDARVGKALEVGVGDRVAVHALREVPEARAEDQAHAHGLLARVPADMGGELLSVP